MSGIEPIERIHALLALYRESHYDVDLPDGVTATIRVGAMLPDEIIGWLGADTHALYMTACNPRSRSLPHEENERRLATLRAEVEARGGRFLEGAGYMAGESWREPSVLASGIALDELDALAAAHDQNAAVLVRPGRRSALRLYRADWRVLLGAADDIEWFDPTNPRGTRRA